MNRLKDKVVIVTGGKSCGKDDGKIWKNRCAGQ